MKLSIITVNYNNPDGLSRTIQSVVSQKDKDFEYIVIDGASTKGDVEIIKENTKFIDYWISEPDGGIYAAMNKGVRVAHGDYCLFLNSGDTLYSTQTVYEINQLDFDEEYIEGCTVTCNGLAKPIRDYSLAIYYYGGNNHHQASLISRKLLEKYPYDETLKIASDMKFNVEVLIVHNCSYRPIDVIISNYEPGGRSSTIDSEEEVNSIFKCFFPPRVLDDYIYNYSFYRFPVYALRPFLKKVSDSVTLFKIKIGIKKIIGKNISPTEYKELKRRQNLKTKR